MDLFYTAEWMARQDQEQTPPVLKKLKIHPVQEDRNVFIMTEGDSEKARIDLHDRNPGEVFKAFIRDNGNTFNIIDDSEDSSSIQLRGEGTLLEAQCRGWLRQRICMIEIREKFLRPVSATMETHSTSSTIPKIRAESSCGETGR